jgi:hypothetical protein
MRVPVLFHALLGALFSLPGLLIIPRLSHAAEWSMEPSVRVASEYDDNIHLTTQPHNTVHGLTAAPKLNLVARSGVWQLNGNVEYERKNYTGENNLDTDNRYFRVGSSYRTERSKWQLYGSMSRASILTLEEVPTDKLIQGYSVFLPDVTSVFSHRIQETVRLFPSWQWSLDETKQLSLSYQYADTSYLDGSSVGLSDSRNRSAEIKFTNQINPVDQVYLSGGYSIFHAPDVAHALTIDVYTIIANAVNPMVLSSKSRSTTYQAGINHAFSENMRGNLSLGSRHTNAEQLYRTCPSPNPWYIPSLGVGGDPLRYPGDGEPCISPYVYRTTFSAQSSSIFSAGLEVQQDNTNTSIGVSRNFQSSSAGDQVRNDTLSFGVNRQITAKLTGSISGNISEYISETRAVLSANYKSNQIQPSLIWQWTEELGVNAIYRHTDMKRSYESKSVTANYVYFGLMYQWPKMTFSR